MGRRVQQYSPQGGFFNVTVTLNAPSGYAIDASSDQAPAGDPFQHLDILANFWLGEQPDLAGHGSGISGRLGRRVLLGKPCASHQRHGRRDAPPFYASVADISIYVDALHTGAPQISNAEHFAETSEGNAALLPPGMVTTQSGVFPPTIAAGSSNYTLIARVMPPIWLGATDSNGNVGNLTFTTPPGVAIYDVSYNLVAGTIGIPASGYTNYFYLLTDQNFTGAGPITATFTWTAPNASGYAQDFARVAPFGFTPTITFDDPFPFRSVVRVGVGGTGELGVKVAPERTLMP